MTPQRPCTDPRAPTVLAFADKMFTPSESFIHRSYKAFSDLQVLFIGHELRSEPPDGYPALELGALHGLTGEFGFKTFGRTSGKLLDALRAEGPCVIHAHFGKSGAYALPLARKLGLPLVVTYYGGDATKTTNTKNSFIRTYNRRRETLWDEAALILPCSNFIKWELVGKGAPEEKMITHHNTADPERFQPGEKKNIILFAGRWVEKKGIDTLVAALGRLGPALKDWRVRLLGDGELKPQLSALLGAAGIEAELPGWIHADDMPKHFAEASIVCVPSKRASSGDAEGLPLVCVEAMLSSSALAATKHAGIPECVIDGVTGYLVDEGDDAGLADRLGRMIADPAATRAMGAAGRELAMSDFNLIKQSQKLENYLWRAAEEAGTLPEGAMRY